MACPCTSIRSCWSAWRRPIRWSGCTTGNVADYWTALEGVSHFLYLAWNAGHDKPVSLLELEMQAEVDKYVASYWLMRRQFPDAFRRSCCGCCSSGRASTRAWRRDARTSTARPAATRRGSADGWSIAWRARVPSPRAVAEREVLAELRRFYRLTNARKVAHIERTA